MPRTTVDIDAPILHDLKRMQKKEGKSLGRLISDLLAQSLAGRRRGSAVRPPFRWRSKPMRARIDLEDKEAVRAAIENENDG